MNIPYFIADNSLGWSNTQIAAMKENYNYLSKAFSHLYVTVDREDRKRIGGAFRNLMLSGRLPKNDNETGLGTNGLAARIKFLIIYLSDEKHPENLERFKKSFIYNSFMYPLVSGYSIDNTTLWKKYQKTSNCEQELIEKNNPYDGALYCWKRDTNAPVGLNFARCFSELIPPTYDGVPYEFEVNDDIDIETEIGINEAVVSHISLLKNNARFKKNYIAPND